MSLLDRTQAPLRIAMWSGPRNISTALLRSWGSRADTFVSDEPLYAHYLDVTGLDHPGRDEVLAHHERDPRRVVDWLLGPVPGDRPIWYQKHMAHHLLPNMERDWIGGLTNVLLIREPREMVVSLAKVLPNPRIEETGLPQQVELFEMLSEVSGEAPLVVDSKDVLGDPRGMLQAMCARLGVPFDEAMLSWAPGPRETDGVWGQHWYENVWKSTGFSPYEPKDVDISARLASLVGECEEPYERLHEHRLVAGQPSERGEG